jgi:RecJ-like exonuclease
MDDKTRRAEENRRVLQLMKYNNDMKLFTSNAFAPGRVIKKDPNALKFPFTPETLPCTRCEGTGTLDLVGPCSICAGKGQIPKRRFTCHTCPDKGVCDRAYDIWNLDGDCVVNPQN